MRGGVSSGSEARRASGSPSASSAATSSTATLGGAPDAARRRGPRAVCAEVAQHPLQAQAVPPLDAEGARQIVLAERAAGLLEVAHDLVASRQAAAAGPDIAGLQWNSAHALKWARGQVGGNHDPAEKYATTP